MSGPRGGGTARSLDPDPLVDVAHLLPRSAVNGPGERFVLWVQGCSIRCPGCWNPDTWSRRPRLRMRASELLRRILSTDGIEGVTFTGGEPFDQARALAAVARGARRAGLGVMAFSGYELADLREGARAELLAECDVVVAGPFVLAERDETLPWRGSRNQRIHWLTDRYGPADLPAGGEFEVHAGPGGELRVTGFPPAELLEAMGVRRTRVGGNR